MSAALKHERIRWEVAPVAGERFAWSVKCRGMLQHTSPFKFLAVLWAAAQCRYELKHFGHRAELRIKGADGQIKDTRTYGDDPRGTRG